MPKQFKLNCKVCFKNIYKRQGYLFYSHCKDNYHKTCIKSADSVELLYNNHLCQPCAHFTFSFHSIDDTKLLKIFKPKIPPQGINI